MQDETKGPPGNGTRSPSDERGTGERARATSGGARVASRSARDVLTGSDARQERGAERGARDDRDEDDLVKAEEGLIALREALETQMRERPYVTLACAVGAGMLLSQALSTRVGRVALLAAGGYAATRFLRDDGMSLLSRMLGEDVDDDDPDEIPATRDVHS